MFSSHGRQSGVLSKQNIITQIYSKEESQAIAIVLMDRFGFTIDHWDDTGKDRSLVYWQTMAR